MGLFSRKKIEIEDLVNFDQAALADVAKNAKKQRSILREKQTL